MPYAQNGSTDAKLWHDEHSKIITVLRKSQPDAILDLSSARFPMRLTGVTVARTSEVGRGRPVGRSRRRRGPGWPRAAPARTAAARGGVRRDGAARRSGAGARRSSGGERRAAAGRGRRRGGRRGRLWPRRRRERVGLGPSRASAGVAAMWGSRG